MSALQQPLPRWNNLKREASCTSLRSSGRHAGRNATPARGLLLEAGGPPTPAITDRHASKRSKVVQEDTGRPATIPLAIHLAIRGSPIGASTAANTAIGPRIAASLAGNGPILPKRKTMAQRCSWRRSAHRWNRALCCAVLEQRREMLLHQNRALCSAVPDQRKGALLRQNRAPLLCLKSIWRSHAPNSTSTLMATAMLISGTLIPVQRTT